MIFLLFDDYFAFFQKPRFASCDGSGATTLTKDSLEVRKVCYKIFWERLLLLIWRVFAVTNSGMLIPCRCEAFRLIPGHSDVNSASFWPIPTQFRNHFGIEENALIPSQKQPRIILQKPFRLEFRFILTHSDFKNYYVCDDQRMLSKDFF